jgi:hypothetical protein
VAIPAVGLFELVAAGARAAREAAIWTDAVTRAGETLERAVLAATHGGEPAIDPDTRVDVHPCSAGTTEVAVTVTLPSGARYTVRRLVRAS